MASAPGRGLIHAGGFARVVCGVDGTREGFEAARQAARLTSAEGRLRLVAVVELFAALSGRWGAEPARWRSELALDRSAEELVAELGERARESLAEAGAQLRLPADIATSVVEGAAHEGLLEAAREHEATLIAIGTHGGGRLAGAALAETTAMVVHEARASVLIARPSFDPERFPATIVVGIDGSTHSQAALDVAVSLRRRAEGRLIVVVAEPAPPTTLLALDDLGVPHELVTLTRRPVDALVTAARTADLLVIGSRGLHGRRALGSVSERAAFGAASSVLVVREPADTGGPLPGS